MMGILGFLGSLDSDDPPAIERASFVFEEGEGDLVEVVMNARRKARYQVPLNEYLAIDYGGTLRIDVYQNCPGAERLRSYLPRDWEKYRRVELAFNGKEVVFYREGKFHQWQKELPNDWEFYDENGAVLNRVPKS